MPVSTTTEDLNDGTVYCDGVGSVGDSMLHEAVSLRWC